MGKTAFIFPGQGSQSIGMGKDLYENYESAKNIYEQFNSVSGKKVSELCFNGPEEILKLTQNTQPAILATSIAALEALKSQTNLKPDYVAGHSLGEYAALYAAGVLSLEDTIKLIVKRGDLMGESKAGGGMSAVLNLDEEKLNECLKKASEFGVISVANYNTPEQIVITGEIEAVNKANELCAEAGAKRVVPLEVSGAFHSPLMKEASEKYSKFVEHANINDAKIPVITNVDAKETTNKDEFKTKMVEQIYSSVYWTQTIKYLIENGVDTFVEIGSGKVLAGMLRRISKEVKVYNVFDKISLENLVNDFVKN